MKLNRYFPSSIKIFTFMILFYTSYSLQTENQKIANQVNNNLKANESQFLTVANVVNNNCECAKNIPQCCTPEYFQVNIFVNCK